MWDLEWLCFLLNLKVHKNTEFNVVQMNLMYTNEINNYYFEKALKVRALQQGGSEFPKIKQFA